MLQRRKLIFGLVGLFAAPAIIKAESLMKLPKRAALVVPTFTPEHSVTWVPVGELEPDQIIHFQYSITLETPRDDAAIEKFNVVFRAV